MCDGIVEDTFYDKTIKRSSGDTIVIKYNNELEIHYIGIVQENIKKNDIIRRGQLIGYKKQGAHCDKYYFLIRIRYKGIYLDPNILFINVKTAHNRSVYATPPVRRLGVPFA